MNEALLVETSALDLAARLRAGELSSLEVTRAYLERIRALDDRLHAFITITEDRALREAAEADGLSRERRAERPLHGIPYAAKDLFAVAGVRTTAGSLALHDNVSARDAAAIARLRSAGAVLLGKTNLTEFAVGPEDPYPYGEPRNPWDLDRVPGASSGGSAIAVAASLAAFALGSDTGGSSRGPAAHCGVVGLRPTWGRIDVTGMVPSSWSADTVGPMARTVGDVAAVFRVLTDASEPERPTGDLRGLRAVVVEEWVDAMTTDPEVVRAFDEATRVLADIGLVVERAGFPRANDAAATFTVITKSDAAFYQRALVRARAAHGTHFRRQMLTASLIPAHVLQKAQHVRALIRRDWRQLFERYDLVLSPTTSRPAERIAHVGDITGVEDALRAFGLPRIQRHVAALAGTPALSLPCGASSSGLPIGLQLMADADREGLLFEVGAAFEHATTWHRARPSLTR